MYDAGVASQSSSAPAVMQRVRGIARVGFGNSGSCTRLADLYQSGSAKVRLPRVYDEPATAVLINTAGGLTGGDVIDYTVDIGAGAHAIVTSQAAERAYRSLGTSANVTSALTVADGGCLEWLPQETILFEHSSVNRSIRADLFGDARLMMLESIVLGREAMGENVTKVSFRDSWRIRRDGALVFADDVKFDGDPACFFGGTATGGGSRALATFADVCLNPEDRLQKARSVLESLDTEMLFAGASALKGALIVRMAARSSQTLKSALMGFLKDYRSASLPRVWHC